MFDYSTLNEDDNLLVKFKHAPHRILEKLVETPDKRLICKVPLDIHLMESYIEKNLCHVGNTIHTIGVFGIVDPATKEFGVFSIPARVHLAVTQMERFTNQENAYRVLVYDKYDTIMETTEIIRDDKLSYFYYNYFIELGRVPWYLHYDAFLSLYDQEWHYTGKSLTPVPQMIDMLLSSVARDPANESLLYRGTIKNKQEVFTKPPKWVPLRNISMGPVDTMNKILGSYYDDGLASAIAEPSTAMTDVEKLLRA